jgi:hypothetical protein
LFIEDHIPAAHTFGVLHDAFMGWVETKVDAESTSWWLINVPSMFVASPATRRLAGE